MITILASALLSGLVATWISIWYRDRYEIRRAKLRLFEQLLGKRHVLLPGPHIPADGTAFSEVVNQIFVVFHDCPKVLTALKAFHEAVTEPYVSSEGRTNKLQELFIEMARHLEINTDVVGEGFFLKAFVISAGGSQELGLQLEGIRFQQGEPSLLAAFSFGGSGSKCDVQLSLEQAEAMGCALVEAAGIARLRRGQAAGLDVIQPLGPAFAEQVQRRVMANRVMAPGGGRRPDA